MQGPSLLVAEGQNAPSGSSSMTEAHPCQSGQGNLRYLKCSRLFYCLVALKVEFFVVNYSMYYKVN